MKKSLFTLLLILVCAISPVQAYEYFTICFADGTKSEPFYASDVDSICYSKTGLDGVVYSDWQVQEIYTCDSVYRYALAQIDSLSFTDVDVNRVAEDLDRANIYIAPLYVKCKDATELATHLSEINEIEGVEGAWADHQTVFVKIRDYGTITYIYPPAMKAGGIQFNYQKALSSQSRRAASATDEHQHVEMGKACIYNQTAKDEDPFFDAARNTFVEMCNMYDCMGISCDAYTNLTPSFFKNEIFDYDHVFLITHGEYDSEKNLHWLYTSEEQFCLDIEDWKSQKQEWLKFLHKYSANSSNQLAIGVHQEIRDGRLFAVYYTKVSEKYILSSTRKFKNPGNAIIFNVACQSLKENENMANAFIQRGAGCYLGYTEENGIGHNGGEYFFANMMNALCVGQAKESIPHEWQEETTGISAVLRKVSLNNDVDNICIYNPETLEAENGSDGGGNSVTLKGQIKMLLPSLMDKYNAKYEVGFVFADDKEMNDTIHIPASGDFDETTRYMTFEKTLNENMLQANKTYYYQAYLKDGGSCCYGVVKKYGEEPYCVLKDNTLTFYYDNLKERKEGLAFCIAEEYKGNGDYPKWTTEDILPQISHASFDVSFANYYPKSTSYWFYSMKNLESIYNIENLHTDSVTDMRYMFGDCTSLTSLDLSSFNTSNVTDIEWMFWDCSSLTSLDLSSFNTSNVTNMQGMFDGCTSLTSLDLSSFNTSNVTNMGYMFSYCTSLTSLDLSSFNTSNVTDMKWMFNDCTSLASLDLSSFDTSNVTDMHGMFSDCTSLTSLDLSSFNTSNVTDMSYMFSWCYSLTSLDLSSFNTSNVTDMNFMFGNCASLTKIYAGNWNNGVYWMFHGCEQLVGGMGTRLGWNNYYKDVNGKTHSYYCPDDGSAAHIDGGKDNPGLFTAK